MMIRRLVSCLFAASLALAGCSQNAFQIYQTQTTFIEEDGSVSSDHNSLLLDRRTGETWILWAGEDEALGGATGYYWIPVMSSSTHTPLGDMKDRPVSDEQRIKTRSIPPAHPISDSSR